MASLALGIVGLPVGSLFGAPQIGFLIGSLIGNLIDPPKQQGPRLGDLKLQASTYGKMHPFIWGRGRLAGNMIDQTDLKEHKQKSGGKGGPVVTTFTYSASFDLALCMTPVFGQKAILGVLRIWADGRLIWDIDTSSDPIPCTVYYGDEAQLPDATFEAIHGVGNVPAYRGLAHVVFADYFLTDFGNRIPALEFEVYTSSGDYPIQISVGSSWKEGGYSVGGFTYDITTGTLTVTSQTNVGFLARWAQFDIDLNQIGSTVYTAADGNAIDAINSNGWIGTEPGVGDVFWEGYSGAGTNARGSEILGSVPSGNLLVAMNGYWFGVAGTPCTVTKAAEGGEISATVAVGAFSHTIAAIGGSDTGDVYIMQVVSGTSELYKYDSDLNLIHHWAAADLAGTKLTDGTQHPNFWVYKNQICFDYRFSSTDYVALVDIDPMTLALSDSVHGPLIQAAGGRITHLANGLFINVNNGIFSLDPPPADIELSTIVSNLSDMVGLNGAYDVSELTDLVHWFVVANQMTTRNAIQSLRSAFFFDAVESDDTIKFRKRSETSTFSIPDEDLCGRQYGEAPGDPLQTQRKREQEIPRTLNFTYIDVDTDYQTGTIPAQRQTTLSQQDVSIEVPVGFTADEAKQKAETLLVAEWIERETFTWSTTRKWAHLEPCDVGLVRGRVIRIQTRTESPNGVIKWTGVLAAPSTYAYDGTRSSIYVQSGSGTNGAPPSDGHVTPDPPGAVVDTTLRFIDAPLIADSDSPNGVYAAIRPGASGHWTGAELFESVDGGTTYNGIIESSNADITGTVATAPGDFGGGNMFDEQNTIRVVLDDSTGTLSSASRTAVLNGANTCVVGYGANAWEVIQFRTATLVVAGTYDLSGLLRGRRGTEWMIPSHVANEYFILMPATMNPSLPFSELGATRQFKAVSYGQAVSDATEQDFANSGIALKCYAPVHLGGGFDASGNFFAQFYRRTRIGGTWLNGVDVPLGEATEAYRIRIYDSSFALIFREFDITVPGFEYTVAEQTTDQGGPQSTIYWGVAQLGSYGAGYETQATSP